MSASSSGSQSGARAAGIGPGGYTLNWPNTSWSAVPAQDDAVQKFYDQALRCAESLRTRDAEVAERLFRAIERVRERRVTIAFGGRFKSGKSLLLNRLLGRDLLPVNIEAETGAPCFIQSGAKDLAISVRGNSRREIPCSTEALREELSLWTRRIGNNRTPAAARIEITLANCSTPANVRWVDTPGLDDTPEMDLAAQSVFRESDVLLWALNSETPLSMTEAAYIRSYVDVTGPHGLLFLTNVMIRDSSEYTHGWGRFVSHQMPVVCNRLHEAAAEMALNGCGPRMLAVCGAAIGRASESEDMFGIARTRQLMQSITSADHPLVRGSRLGRAAIALDEAATEAYTRHQAEAREAAKAEAAVLAWQNTISQKRSLFELKIAAALDTATADFRAAATAAARAVSANVTAADFKRDDTYSRQLGAEFEQALQRVQNAAANAINQAEEENQQKAQSEALDTEFPNAFAPFSVNVVVPNNPVSDNGAVGAGLVVGFAVGMLTFGLGGVAAGLATAAARGNAATKKALALDYDGAKANIQSEANRVAKEFEARMGVLKGQILASVHHGPCPLASPDRRAEQQWRQVGDQLTALAKTARRMASQTA